MLVEEVERVRKLKKMSQKELAIRIGMSVTNYNNLVNISKDFWYSDLVKICDVLNVPMSTFIDKLPTNTVIEEPKAQYEKSNVTKSDCSTVIAERDFYKNLYEQCQRNNHGLILARETLNNDLGENTGKKKKQKSG